MKNTLWLFPLILILGFLISCDCDDPEIVDEVPIWHAKYNIAIYYEGEIPVGDEIEMELNSYKDGDDVIEVFEGKVERRGGFSISYPKHSYKLDIKGDVYLAGLPEDDDFILNANYIDKTFLRHVISYDVYREMHDNNIASKTEYVELDLNSTYNGLYVLMERLDKSSLQINKDDENAVIFKEPHIFRESYVDVQPQDDDNFHQQTYPKKNKDDKTDFIEEVRDFILNSGDDEFRDDFATHFDIQSIIDWHLLLLISNNNDGILKNFYLYKIGSSTPLRVAPWDYDHSFGRDGDNELNLDTRPMDISRSILFDRLLEFDWYTRQLKDRWSELNNIDILSVSGLKDRIASKEDIIKDRVEKNFDLWPLDASEYYDDNNFEEEVDIMNQFVDIRHARLTSYFNDL